MAIKVATEGGFQYVLNRSFRPEGVPFQLSSGGIRVDGRTRPRSTPGLFREEASLLASVHSSK